MSLATRQHHSVCKHSLEENKMNNRHSLQSKLDCQFNCDLYMYLVYARQVSPQGFSPWVRLKTKLNVCTCNCTGEKSHSTKAIQQDPFCLLRQYLQ